MDKESDVLDRITVRPDVFGGRRSSGDMRIAVGHVLGMLAAGDAAEMVLREYPELDSEDVRACLRFAHRSVAGEQVHDRLPVREALEECRGRLGGRHRKV